MDQEREDYTDPESPGQKALTFDLSAILGAVILAGLAFLPMLLLAAAYHFGMRP